MKFSVAENSGLSGVDPLYGFLLEVDRILKNYRWCEVHQKIPEKQLLALMVNSFKDVRPSEWRELCDCFVGKLQNLGEPILAYLIHQLSLTEMRIFLILSGLVYILINLEYFKCAEGRFLDVRSIDSGWLVEEGIVT